MTYTNPLNPRSFADPFVLKWNGRYYGYATGDPKDGRVFPMMTSNDLVSWTPVEGAMIPLDDRSAHQYWAPEVAYRDGVFYLYYAVIAFGTPEHHLRVATSEAPLGPFNDCGVNLTPDEVFAIDAHPFRDDDGKWFLFYARDYFEPPFIGTGLAVDRLETMTRLSGSPARVLRPYAEWQLYERERAEKGGVDWYTAEGPFLLKRHGRYTCLYSGGAWRFPNYGVADAVSDIPMGTHGLEDRSYWDRFNEGGPNILRTIPGKVLGPGHNSVTVAPNNIGLYLVYHGWDPEATHRMLRIDRLHWHGDRPFCSGASFTPQQSPALPPFHDPVSRADADSPGPLWSGDGWGIRSGAITPVRPGAGPLLATAQPAAHLLLEINLILGGSAPDPAGVVLMGEDGARTSILLIREDQAADRGGSSPGAINLASPGGAWRQLLILKQGPDLEIRLDGQIMQRSPIFPSAARFALEGGTGACFCGIAAAPHFLDDFGSGAEGWEPVIGSDYSEGRWVVRSATEQSCSSQLYLSRDGAIEQRDVQATMAAVRKGDPVRNLELSLDLSIIGPTPECGRAGVLLGLRMDGSSSWNWSLFVQRNPSGWEIGIEERIGVRIVRQTEPLNLLDYPEHAESPAGNLRVRIYSGRLEAFWDERSVLVAEDPDKLSGAVDGDSQTRLAGPVALFTDQAAAVFRNVVVTGLPD
ncbi:MAG TPA: family 43 glycosylhydrolase [Armatimonadota bacterium]|nr:family 43 glycosylhydrolase [Armatimonadota bacterium]